MDPLENAVERLLQRNSQLSDRCARLQNDRGLWRRQRLAILAEVEGLLVDLELLREQQS